MSEPYDVDVDFDDAAFGETNDDDARHLSPTALNRFLGCEHRTYLDLLERRNELDAERRPPRMQLLFERGDRFEEEKVSELEGSGRKLLDLSDGTAKERAERTIGAMRAGADAIYQGCFLHGDWIGFPDFLLKVDDPYSDLGEFSYEVHDAKLGGTARPNHIFQLLFYNEALERIQSVRPSRMHLMLGSGEFPSFSPDEFSAYAAQVRAQFEERYKQLAGGSPDPMYPYPVGACEFCHWWHVCAQRRRDDDHLSLVANLHRAQGLKLEAAGVHALPALAQLPADAKVPRLTKSTLTVLRDQASLQLASRAQKVPLHHVLEPAHDRGLGRLPDPSLGDVHFDFEGDQFWGDDGLEYLFGTLHGEDGEWRYWPIWAHSRAEEQAAFQQWIDWITARLERFPDMHIFHYNAYEPVALKKLQARFGTHEHQLDELLRRKVFVDLYGITRQAIRIGTEGYGLKALEPAFGFKRNAKLQGAVGSMRHWQTFQEDGDPKHLTDIALYNEDDVRSTVALYEWLRERRPEAEAVWDIELSILAPEPSKPLSPAAQKRMDALESLRPRLLGGLPDDESQDTPEERARRVAFALVGYHSREAKPVLWALYNRREKTLEQLRDEDSEAIAGLEVIERIDDDKAWIWNLRFPEQEYKLSPGNVDDSLAENGVALQEVDETTRTVVVRRSKKCGEDAPRALGPGWPFRTHAQQDALMAFAERIATQGLNRAEAGLDLLLRRSPRLREGAPPLKDEPADLSRLRTQVRGLDRSALVIQGPPGTGKTYTGARLALDLIGEGRRVGVMASSHKAIDNLLRAVDEAADETGQSFRGWRKKPSSGNGYSSSRIHCKQNPDTSEGEVLLHAGTAWHWASPGATDSVDVLFIDEAGQVSLADAIAVAQGTRSLVLLGDPQQLAHVSQGTHLYGSGGSVLGHMLDGQDTVSADRGVLLEQSWRMHPDVCNFVSRTMYDNRLYAQPDCVRQHVESSSLGGTGLRMIPVEHVDNRGRSVEESAVIAAEIDGLLADGWYTDREGTRHRVTLDDILVVAPYNAQVRCLKSKLGAGARVGTVDKFQGQEAPIVFFSMASSSSDDIARGMSFLFSRNRLNVAISRAQSLAVVVCSPRLLSARCSTVEDMRLVNLLCRVREEARLEDAPVVV